MLWPERDRDFAMSWNSYVLMHVWSEISGQEVDKRSNADAGLEINNRSAGKCKHGNLLRKD